MDRIITTPDNNPYSERSTIKMSPLAVDLDGTLVMTDTLHETLIRVFKTSPVEFLRVVATLRHGKAAFKKAASKAAPINPETLPYNKMLLQFLRQEKKRGRPIGLFTAADQTIADAVACHLSLFEAVEGSDGVNNLSGERKTQAIVRRFGGTFSYAGDSAKDRPIFASAVSVILAGRPNTLTKYVPPGIPIEKCFDQPGNMLIAIAAALRPRHWIKNSLVFIPLFLGIYGAIEVIALIRLFLTLSILSSATYILNDLFDLESDRAHPIKSRRPFARGALTPAQGLLVSVLSLCIVAVECLISPPVVFFIMSGYLVGTLFYTILIKHVPMADVTLLAGLFTWRIMAGMYVIDSPISPWLLTFSMLFFTGLALIKRYAELQRATTAACGATVRGYTRAELPLILASGVAAGFASIVIFMIYLITEQYPRSIYAHPNLLWAVMPILLFWILRMWRLAVIGRMSEDPVIFAMRDRTSLLAVASIGLILFGARL